MTLGGSFILTLGFCGITILIHQQDLEASAGSPLFPPRELVKAELQFLNSAYTVPLTRLECRISLPDPSHQA